ncbi:MAG: TrpB-like pyridoxal phosphate-dependent enzyme [Candidatus Heimdallarchaeota archaeon]|nr:TrpB-like pyridoxal phosphate-dependent enzyme [Candidatus Heimdallarchaeota archaeon]
MTQIKIQLEENELPKQWYNILPDLPSPLAPPLHPKEKKPIGPQDLTPIFPMELIKQEVSQERFIDIPKEVADVYRMWRPTPLYRAKRLEEALKTPAKIFFKWEGVSPPGSHKPNTAVAQAYYNMKEGVERLTTETGAGQWGSALAFSCKLFDLECMVYMVRASYDQKPYRKVMMQAWGANIVASPSKLTKSGKKYLKEDPDCTGSLGIAISEAVEDAMENENSKYSLGSVLNHVMLHQSIIGLEAKKQFEKIDLYPDEIYCCVGGGSNFSGFSYPFIADKLTGKQKNLEIIACESEACPSLTKGLFAYDYGDSAQLAPIVKMFTLGHNFIPSPIHAGGLRYHGSAPIISLLNDQGIIKSQAYRQNATFEAATLFAQTEGFLVAPESAHAVKAVIDAALRCKENNEENVIVFNNSGHGHFDLAAYQDYYAKKLIDYEYPTELVKKATAELPEI